MPAVQIRQQSIEAPDTSTFNVITHPRSGPCDPAPVFTSRSFPQQPTIKMPLVTLKKALRRFIPESERHHGNQRSCGCVCVHIHTHSSMLV